MLEYEACKKHDQASPPIVTIQDWSQTEGDSKTLVQPVLPNIQSYIAEVGRPLPLQIIVDVNRLKREALSLSQKIAQSKGDGVEDLDEEQKDLVKQAIGVTMKIIIFNKAFEEEDDKGRETGEC